MKIKNKPLVIIVFLVACLVLSVYSNVLSKNLIGKYESYISGIDIANRMRPMGTQINYTNKLLKKVVSKKSITKEEVQFIYSDYHTFAFGLQDLIYLYETVGDGEYNFTASNSRCFDVYWYFDTLYNEMKKSKLKVKVLNAQDIINMQRISNITKSYQSIFGTGKYNEWDYDVSKKDWITVLNKIVHISDKSFTEF